MNPSDDKQCSFKLGRWHYVYGQPQVSATLRAHPEDFLVHEELGFVPEPGDQHLWIELSKRLLNTQDVVSLIAKSTGVAARDVGFSGLKDRNAVTRQWFSLPIGRDLEQMRSNVQELCQQHSQINMHQCLPGRSKLKRGVHKRNSFEITLRNSQGDTEFIEYRLSLIKSEGFANYFGDQRFGRNGKNLLTALQLFSDPKRKIDRFGRSMALSSARSWLFNVVLSERLNKSGLERVEPGDVLQLNGTNAWFLHDGSDPNVIDRIKQHDLHPTGPLWGRGELASTGAVAEFEHNSIQSYSELATGLVNNGLEQQRRALRVIPELLCWEVVQPGTMRIGFSLPRGCFATALLREVVHVSN